MSKADVDLVIDEIKALLAEEEQRLRDAVLPTDGEAPDYEAAAKAHGACVERIKEIMTSQVKRLEEAIREAAEAKAAAVAERSEKAVKSPPTPVAPAIEPGLAGRRAIKGGK